MLLQISGIVKDSVLDGPGLRLVVFTQGCPHRCPGCHNPDTHDPNGGARIDTDEIAALARRLPLIRGVTFSGGEPFMQAAPLAALAAAMKDAGLNLVTYTGYRLEQLLQLARRRPDVRRLLSYTDILVDGPFEIAKRDLRLSFRGSSNQRLIDVPRTLEQGRPVLWRDETTDFLLVKAKAAGVARPL